MNRETPAVVIGLDLSLKATGIAHPDGTSETYGPTAEGASNAGMDRLCEIRDYLAAVLRHPRHLELVMVEALAFDSRDTRREQAQLAGIVRALLYDHDIPFLLVAPGTLKKYATGHGLAPKVDVLQAAEKRLGYHGTSFDEADALWLRAIGCELLGVPVVAMPQHCTDALKALRDRPPVKRRR